MVLNGVIIGGAYNTGIPTSGVFFATALASAIFTFMMGFMVNVPVALAPGMGLNGYFNTVAGGVCWPHSPTPSDSIHAVDGLWGKTGKWLPPAPPGFMFNSPDSQFLLNNDGPWWGANGGPPTAKGFPGNPTGEQLIKAYFPGGWPGGDQNVHVPSCASWGVSKLPWSDAMGAVFISGWFYLFFTFTGLRSSACPQRLRCLCCAAANPLSPCSAFQGCAQVAARVHHRRHRVLYHDHRPQDRRDHACDAGALVHGLRRQQGCVPHRGARRQLQHQHLRQRRLPGQHVVHRLWLHHRRHDQDCLLREQR